jgi:hypothetical protein
VQEIGREEVEIAELMMALGLSHSLETVS